MPAAGVRAARGPDLRSVVAEGIGTAAVVATACAAVTSPSDLAPVAAPAVWGALLVAGRGLGGSGLFLNPALVAAAWVVGRIRTRDLTVVLVAQTAGAVAGAAAGVRVATGLALASPDPAPYVGEAGPPALTAVPALVAEVVVVLSVTVVALLSAPSSWPTTAATVSGTAVAGLPVALVASPGAVLVGPLTGAAFNPAVAAALAHADVIPWDVAVAYVPAHLAGALIAALVVLGLSSRPRAREAPATPPVPRPRDPAPSPAHAP